MKMSSSWSLQAEVWDLPSGGEKFNLLTTKGAMLNNLSTTLSITSPSPLALPSNSSSDSASSSSCSSHKTTCWASQCLISSTKEICQSSCCLFLLFCSLYLIFSFPLFPKNSKGKKWLTVCRVWSDMTHLFVCTLCTSSLSSRTSKHTHTKCNHVCCVEGNMVLLWLYTRWDDSKNLNGNYKKALLHSYIWTYL